MPKVLIDIPDRMNKLIHSDSQIDWMDMSHILYIIKNGIVLDGLTNGEVMKRMFSDAKVYQSGGYTNMTFKGGTFFEDRESDWWNRKWGE